jgi:hypothetical protein
MKRRMCKISRAEVSGLSIDSDHMDNDPYIIGLVRNLREVSRGQNTRKQNNLHD